MKRLRLSDLKYFAVLTIPLGVWTSLHFDGIVSYLIPFSNFLLIPLLDMLFPAIKENPTPDEEAHLKTNPLFDWLLYINIPCQIGLLFYMLFIVSFDSLPLWEKIGKVWSMGICSAVLGINTAHELGHRNNKTDAFCSKLLLMTTCYMHFFIEHNRGHHKNVATPLDPATARKGQTVFAYYFRSIIGGYLSAWRIANKALRKKGMSSFSFKNEMIQMHVIQMAFITIVYWLFGFAGLTAFLFSSIIGILIMETINYIEHYGLQRKKLPDGRYEKVQPSHSWNSDHILGRIMLLELTRHSDHHYKASKKYQTLVHYDDSPQLPFGYPGSMVLSWIPPLWFKVMNKRIPQ